MKRKLLSLPIILLLIISLVGCSANGLSLLKEIRATAAWEATELTGEMTVDLSLLGEKVTVTSDYTAYSNTESLQIEMELNIKDIQTGEGESAFPSDFKFSPIKLYMDGMTFYVSTSYITELFAVAGMDPSAYADLNNAYLALDLSDAMAGMDLTNMAEMTESSYDLFENMEFDLPITKKDRTYTISLDDTQMVDAYVALIKESLSLPMLEDMLAELGKTATEMEAEKAEAVALVEEAATLVKPYIKGSTATVTYDFKDAAFTSDSKVNLLLNIEDVAMNMTISSKQSVKKAPVKAIAFPTDVKVYTMGDLESLLLDAMNASAPIVVASSDVIVVNGTTYIPFRSSAQQLGLNVTFDPATKKTYVVFGEEKEEVPTILVNGTSYVDIEAFAVPVKILP